MQTSCQTFSVSLACIPRETVLQSEHLLTERTKMIPAILATAPAPTVSDRYKFVSTRDYIDAFEGQGWHMVEGHNVRSRKSDPAFAKHMVTFSRHDGAQRPDLGGLSPRIHLVNSHNGTSRVQLVLGILRLVCSNGLMVSAGEIAEVSFRHDRSARDTAQVVSELFASDSMRQIEQADRWQSIEMTNGERREFAIKAKNERFGEDSNVEPEALLVPRRAIDTGNTLWQTFNVLQENCLQGGLRFNGMRRTSRRVTNIDKNVALNRFLWQTAMEFAATFN